MKNKLLIIAFALSFYLPAYSQMLYTSTVETGSRYSPASGTAGTPIIVFDDVLIPSTQVQGSDSISITKVNFGIRRIAAAPAMTLNFYYTILDDTSTTYSSAIAIPPVNIGTVNLPANGPSSVTSIISLGDSINPLFKIKTDTGARYTGYQLLFLGLSFTGADDAGSNGWRLTLPGNGQSDNDDVMWLYDVDAAMTRQARVFSGNTLATFYLQVFGHGLTTVPVTLAAFSARRSGKVNLLNWTTEQEFNTSHFTIERSSNGRIYTTIGQVNALGSSDIQRHYNFTDSDPSKGINYYRLRITDKDNSSKFSATRSIRNAGLADVRIFPNPAINLMNILVNADRASSGQLTITGATGVAVYTRTLRLSQGNTTLSLPVKNLPAGTYTMKMQLNEDIIVQQFTKQ